MTRTEGNAPMDAKTLEALKGSIVKWEAIVAGTGQDLGVSNCPLCQLFYRKGDRAATVAPDTCIGCPVMERTGETLCGGSPYERWASFDSEEDIITTPESLAQDELDFLKSLLPTEKRP